MSKRLHTGGYVYGSDPNTPLERTTHPIDRFTVAILALILAITLGAVWFAILPAALDAPPASASHAPDVKAVAGRDIR